MALYSILVKSIRIYKISFLIPPVLFCGWLNGSLSQSSNFLFLSYTWLILMVESKLIITDPVEKISSWIDKLFVYFLLRSRRNQKKYRAWWLKFFRWRQLLRKRKWKNMRPIHLFACSIIFYDFFPLSFPSSFINTFKRLSGPDLG